MLTRWSFLIVHIFFMSYFRTQSLGSTFIGNLPTDRRNASMLLGFSWILLIKRSRKYLNIRLIRVYICMFIIVYSWLRSHHFDNNKCIFYFLDFRSPFDELANISSPFCTCILEQIKLLINVHAVTMYIYKTITMNRIDCH